MIKKAQRLKHADLCAGIGGFALGFQNVGFSYPTLFCDNDKYCQRILKKHWPDVPIVDDVRQIADDPDGSVSGDIDILTAGFPCQPFSKSGRRHGAEDDRHLWPDLLRIVEAKRPPWVVFENVYGLVSLGLDEVLISLETAGYSVRTFAVPASAVGAWHERERIWIVGYAPNDRWNRWRETFGAGRSAHKSKQSGSDFRGQFSGSGQNVADAQSIGVQRCGTGWQRESLSHEGQRVPLCGSERPIPAHWEAEPRVDRVVDGLPNRVDRIKALGNAIVPQVAERIGWTIFNC